MIGKLGRGAFIAFLMLVGLVLAAGGVLLVIEGGSPWYLGAGLAVSVSAFGLWSRRRYAAGVYGAMLAATLVWSLWEAGLDPWALLPRLAGPAIVGLVFLLPGLARRHGAPRLWVGVPAVAALFLLVATSLNHHFSESGLDGARPLAVDHADPGTWPHWGGDIGGRKFARAAAINTDTVAELELAWRYDSNIAPGELVSLEAAPIAMDGRLYICLESGTMVALGQDDGHEIWRYRALPPGSPFLGWKCRGAAYHASAQEGPCARRLFLTSAAGQLIALAAGDGRPCSVFADNGIADLREGMGEMAPDAALPTSPPAVVGDTVVVGQSISDFESIDAPSGVVRGYDALKGALIWAWDVGRPGQTRLLPGETYTRDTPNAWGVFSGDEALGLVFVGTGNSPPDYYAGKRSAVADDYTDNIVAIDAATGEERWRFRTVNHDLWDYDIAAQPVAVDLPGNVPALLVPTKRGEIFVLDRRSGRPIDPVEQRPVPQGAVSGDRTAPTQPYTTGFPSVGGPRLRERDMWGITPLDQMACRIAFRRARYEGEFTPITTEPTITYPAVGGGINWGSVAVDPLRGLLVVNALRLANLNRLEKRAPGEAAKGGFEGGVITFPQAGTPYAFKSFPFLSPIFTPCQEPPFGTITVFDIATRERVWEKPLGTAAGSGPLGIASRVPLLMGAPNFGGPLATAGGLAFIAAAQDRRLRAFDIANGRELWSASLPAIGAANPISYVSPTSGRQYVVIAAGGHFSIPGPHAAAIMAFALPEKGR